MKLNFEKPVFDFSVLYPKKSGLSKILKVPTLDIRIKQSGLKVSNIIVSSSGKLAFLALGSKIKTIGHKVVPHILKTFDLFLRSGLELIKRICFAFKNN